MSAESVNTRALALHHLVDRGLSVRLEFSVMTTPPCDPTLSHYHLAADLPAREASAARAASFKSLCNALTVRWAVRASDLSPRSKLLEYIDLQIEEPIVPPVRLQVVQDHRPRLKRKRFRGSYTGHVNSYSTC